MNKTVSQGFKPYASEQPRGEATRPFKKKSCGFGAGLGESKCRLSSKIIIVLMSLLYLLGPLHVEVNSLLHTITHTIEKPDTVLAHQKRTGIVNAHKSIKHKNATLKHDHKIIDLVDDILEGAEKDSESPEKQEISLKVDKHIRIQTNIAKDEEILICSQKSSLWKTIKNKIEKGYKNDPIKPPLV